MKTAKRFQQLSALGAGWLHFHWWSRFEKLHLSDSKGEIQGSFYISNTRPIRRVYVNGVGQTFTVPTSGRYRAGIKEFKLLDTTNNDYTEAKSKATAYYTVTGALPLSNVSILNTRHIEYAHPYINPASLQTNFESWDEFNSVPAAEVALIEPHVSGQWCA